MKSKFILALIVSIGILFSVNAYAETTDVNVDKNFAAGRIIISGKCEKQDIVTIQIIPQGIGLGEFAASDNREELVLYTNDYESLENESFEFDIKVTKTGNYTAFIGGEKSDIKEVEIGYFANKDTYEKAIKEVNDDFLGSFEKNIEDLGFSDEINGTINISDAAALMKNELGSDARLTASEFYDNVNLYKKCAAIIALNEKKLKNASDYIKDILEADKQLKEFWNKHADTEEKQLYLTKHMSGRSIKNTDDLKIKLKEALTLTAVKYPDGYMNIASVFNAYKDVLGLTAISNKDSVYKGLADKGEFSDKEALIKEYNELINAKEGSGGSGGSSSLKGSGGGDRVANNGIISTIKTPVTGDEKPELHLKFDDLGSVLWAYPSISVLYEEGIINGFSDTEFMPEGLVTREQFVKMLMLSMKLDISNESAGFSDVDQTSWYADFVNTAYKNNVVNGFSATQFGVGENITRQDMAVMIYKAMVKCGFSGEDNDTEFSDDGDISDYAKTAVSKLSKAGIINGTGNNMFSPRQTATRAETAVITERALKYFR